MKNNIPESILIERDKQNLFNYIAYDCTDV